MTRRAAPGFRAGTAVTMAAGESWAAMVPTAAVAAYTVATRSTR
ncbi:hypothetical protein SAURM35S_06218 [Streptomyces aurantiogriseus]